MADKVALPLGVEVKQRSSQGCGSMAQNQIMTDVRMELGKGRGLVSVRANTLFAQSLGLSGLGSPETGAANGSGSVCVITSDTVYMRYIAAGAVIGLSLVLLILAVKTSDAD